MLRSLDLVSISSETLIGGHSITMCTRRGGGSVHEGARDKGYIVCEMSFFDQSKRRGGGKTWVKFGPLSC